MNIRAIPVRQILMGLLYNALFLVGFAFIYGVFLARLVASTEWAKFLGEFWFFAIVAMALPIIFFVRGKKAMCVGAFSGIAAYLLVLAPLAFVLSH
jgi:hypothetical protein